MLSDEEVLHHPQLAVLAAEGSLHGLTKRLLLFLQRWRRPKAAGDVRDVGLALARDTAAVGLWSNADVHAIETFFCDLRQLG